VPAEPTLRDAAELQLLGTRVPRVDGHAIVTGTATYGIDAKIPGMRYAAIARPPVHHGRIARWDGTAWHALGLGFVGQDSASISGIAAFDEDERPRDLPDFWRGPLGAICPLQTPTAHEVNSLRLRVPAETGPHR